jgi:hypothetical protein
MRTIASIRFAEQASGVGCLRLKQINLIILIHISLDVGFSFSFE